MYCVKCGKEVGGEDVFCRWCGARQAGGKMEADSFENEVKVKEVEEFSTQTDQKPSETTIYWGSESAEKKVIEIQEPKGKRADAKSILLIVAGIISFLCIASLVISSLTNTPIDEQVLYIIGFVAGFIGSVVVARILIFGIPILLIILFIRWLQKAKHNRNSRDLLILFGAVAIFGLIILCVSLGNQTSNAQAEVTATAAATKKVVVATTASDDYYVEFLLDHYEEYVQIFDDLINSTGSGEDVSKAYVESQVIVGDLSNLNVPRHLENPRDALLNGIQMQSTGFGCYSYADLCESELEATTLLAEGMDNLNWFHDNFYVNYRK